MVLAMQREIAPSKDMSQVMQELKSIPFKPRLPFGGRVSTTVGWAFDVTPMLLDTWKKTAGLLYPYPSYFKPVIFSSLDGTPLSGELALHNDGKARPGLVFCHGLLGSKNQNCIRKVSIAAYRKWGYNVLALDLRTFGQSRNLSGALPTGGKKEGEDIIAAARFLGSFAEVTTVGVSGYSMGAASTLVASGMDRGESITGGALAWSGFSDTRRMIEFISKFPLPWQPYALVYPIFTICFKLKMLDFQLKGFKDFVDFFRYSSEEYYGVPEAEGYALASPMNYLDKIETPTIHIHAEDDPVVPVLEAEDNLAQAASNSNLDVWILPKGGHCSFGAVDPSWYENVLRAFFDAWAERP